MALRVHLLGIPSLRSDVTGEELELSTRRARGLVYMLAARPRLSLTRRQLAHAMWPDRGEDQSRASLRQALSDARRALRGCDVELSGDQDHVVLEPEHVWVDLHAFDAALRAGTADALREAMSLYRGPFLEGFPPLTDPFDDWVFHERQRLTELFLGALDRAFVERMATGELELVQSMAERALELEPSRETAHRALMAVHLERGDRGAAAKQYAACREALSRELGVSPSSETEDLHRRATSVAVEPVGRAAPPRLAVLPLVNLSGEPEQEYFARGLAEDIITELSRSRSLAVTARHASFGLPAHPTPRHIAEQLGAEYALEGSVRRAGEQLRMAVRLSETASGTPIWGERFDAKLEDVFRVQDEIVAKVVGVLTRRIADAGLERARRRAPQDLHAYDCWLRGLDCLRRGTPGSDDEARAFFEQALAIDPHFARAYAGMSLSHFNEWSCQAWERWDEREGKAFEYAQAAVALDDADHITQCILGRIHLYRREFEKAERHLERAVALTASDADTLVWVGMGKAQLGDAEGGYALARKAMELNPSYPEWYLGGVGFTLFFQGRFDEALTYWASAPDAYTDSPAFMAAACALSGQEARAEERAQSFVNHFRRNITFGREPEPGEALRWVLHVNPLRRDEDRRLLEEGLVRAGLGG
jgi:TolB-like protein/Tfp pilus assembly protein PilF